MISPAVGRWCRTLRGPGIVGASSAENISQAVIAFMAGVLERSLTRIFLRQVHRKGPRPGPCRRIVTGHRPLDSLRAHRLEALDETQRVATGAAVGDLILEVGRLDDQRVAVPMAT